LHDVGESLLQDLLGHLPAFILGLSPRGRFGLALAAASRGLAAGRGRPVGDRFLFGGGHREASSFTPSSYRKDRYTKAFPCAKVGNFRPCTSSAPAKIASTLGGLFAPIAVALKISRPLLSVRLTASPATAEAPGTQAIAVIRIGALAVRRSPALTVSRMRG